MQDRELDHATLFRVADNLRKISGRAAADEVNPGSRTGQRKIFRRIARCGMLGLGAAIALLPLQPQALAWTNNNQAILPTGFLDVSTVASNGDQNPYGVAFVPNGFPSGGKLSPGDILVSNFNNAGTSPTGNIQGTGTTIVKVTPQGVVTTFFTGTFMPPLQGGLTTALGVLKRGFVVVGQLPNSGGTPEPGSLLFLDKSGMPVGSPYTMNLDGPWDLTIDDDFDHASIFVSNVLNGTVVRLDVSVSPTTVSVTKNTLIATGYQHGLSDVAFVLGPTGLAYDESADVLYVASTLDNKIFAISNAEHRTAPPSNGTGVVIYQDNVHLRGPLALALAPNGHLVTSNGDAVNPPPASPPPLPSQLVEFTKQGQFVGQLSIDPVAGAAFGLAFSQVTDDTVRFAAVNDDDNTIDVLTLNIP